MNATSIPNDAPSRLPIVQRPQAQLVICGFAVLFWELLLIRWLGSNVRVVGYFTNFVLISAFFGLGLGSLLSRFAPQRSNLLFPLLAATVLCGYVLSHFLQVNPTDAREFIWIGRPSGVVGAGPGLDGTILSAAFVLPLVYLLVAGAFAAFGQWLGILFRKRPPLEAYSYEIGGSILGIAAFALMSYLSLQPCVWVVIGIAALFLITEPTRKSLIIGGVCAAAILASTIAGSRGTIWSPYYKIVFEPMTEIRDVQDGRLIKFDHPFGYSLTVNNDYHQMMLDLRPKENEHAFFRTWREFYDAPYQLDAQLPDGPILVVGAGTGNDVMAALRSTKREIVAVEIDRRIAELGRAYHFEKPYDSPRVHVVIDDARSYFQKTDRRFALIVFGFLDSHTLTSSFSSLRLDNFVYTKDAFERVREILLPGGAVTVTFATNREWLHTRFIDMLTSVFGQKTEFLLPQAGSYANGIVYRNVKRIDKAPITGEVRNVPTDDWPFLYLAKPAIPRHYLFFIVVMSVLGFLPLLTLPKGERALKMPYFFLGAAFFLLESSNVVSLALLFGSTWNVTVLVFTGILTLVLLGNLTAARLSGSPLQVKLFFLGIAASLALAYSVEKQFLLSLDSWLLKGTLAVLVYLGPVFFASLIFASLIRREDNLYQAYGSNLLGAVIGGACEYVSLLLGFQFLLILTAVFYLMCYVSVFRRETA